MASLNDEDIKQFAESKDYGKFYEDYKAIKSEKDLKKFKEKYKFTIQALQEKKQSEDAENLYEQIMQANPELEGMTRAEIMALPDFNEQLGKVLSQNYDIVYGMPDNLFLEKGDMDNKDWVNAERAKFNAAGYDFDNLEHRSEAARKQSKAESRAAAKEKKTRGPLENYLDIDLEFATPRSSAKEAAGEEVTTADAVSDLLRIGEAGTPIIAVPSIIARNIVEGVADDKDIEKAAKDLGFDLSLYMATAMPGGLLNKVGGRRKSAKVTAEFLNGDKGTGKDVVKAVDAALEGKKASVFNPYRESAAEAVEKAGMSEPQKAKFKGLLSNYMDEGFNRTGLEKKAAESSSNKFQMGEKALNEQIEKEASKMGESALKNTKDAKLDFDTVAGKLTAEQAEELNQLLASRGLRDAEGNAVYTSVNGYGRNAKAAHEIAENKVIMEYLKKNKMALKNVFWEDATNAVKKTYGTSFDKEFVPLAAYVANAPVAYDRVLSVKGLKTAGKAAVINPLRKYLTDMNAKYDYSQEE